MSIYRFYKGRRYQHKGYGSNSYQGRIECYLKSCGKFVVPSELGFAIGKRIVPRFAIDSLFLQGERFLFRIMAKDAYKFFRDHPLVSHDEFKYVERHFKDNPRKTIIVNSIPFLKIQKAGLTHVYDFSLWDRLYDKLTEYTSFNNLKQ